MRRRNCAFVVRHLLAAGLVMASFAPLAADGRTNTPRVSVVVTTRPQATTTSTAASFAWTASSGSRVWCSLDGGSAGACTSPKSYNSLRLGAHSFTVTAWNKQSNQTVTVPWTIVSQAPPPPPAPAPTISMTSTPPSSTTDTGAAFAWTTQNVTSVSCSLDGGSASACASPRQLTGLSAGGHTFVATVSGSGGTASASYSWTITPAQAPPPSQSWPANPYVGGSVWNPVDPLGSSVQVDPSSSRYVSFWLSHLTSPKFVIGPWSVPVVTVTGGEPTYTINIVPNGHAASNINRFGPVPIPLGTRPDSGSDGHLAILDYARGIEWDMWQARYDSASNTWTATCGDAVSFSDRAVPGNICGANTAGFPAAAGLVTPEEIAAGAIKHPLVFASNNLGTPSGKVFRCPATASWGNSSDPSALVAGMWLQLDPSVDVDALNLPTWQKTIARALQQYGAYVRDQTGGGDADFYAENTVNRTATPTWAQLGITANTPFAAAFPWSRVRVLQPSC
jgi:hypothetical protein